MSVLSQALSSASHSHKVEFTVRSVEEFNVVMGELKDCGATLQRSSSRLANARMNETTSYVQYMNTHRFLESI